MLSLARLAPEKRLPELLRAFALVARDHPDARLTVAGVGELEATLRADAPALGLADRVDFPGFVDADKALADADVVAMLSVWENCSYTLLDAAVAGLGVVASPVGGNPEILPDAVPGRPRTAGGGGGGAGAPGSRARRPPPARALARRGADVRPPGRGVRRVGTDVSGATDTPPGREPGAGRRGRGDAAALRRPRRATSAST